MAFCGQVSVTIQSRVTRMIPGMTVAVKQAENEVLHGPCVKDLAELGGISKPRGRQHAI
jgi:hypothetical protein